LSIVRVLSRVCACVCVYAARVSNHCFAHLALYLAPAVIRAKSCQYSGVSALSKQIMDGTECFIRAKDNRGAVFETIRGIPSVELGPEVEALTYLMKACALDG